MSDNLKQFDNDQLRLDHFVNNNIKRDHLKDYLFELNKIKTDHFRYNHFENFENFKIILKI